MSDKILKTIKNHIIKDVDMHVKKLDNNSYLFKGNKDGRHMEFNLYTLFEGIYFLDVKTDLSEVLINNSGSSSYIYILHCNEGCVEIEKSDGSISYLGSGDMLVGGCNQRIKNIDFPLHSFKGGLFFFDTDISATGIMELSEKILGSKINLISILDKTISDKSPSNDLIYRSSEIVGNIFSTVNQSNPHIKTGVLRLKILELLLFLDKMDHQLNSTSRKYFNRNQVETVKEIKRYVLNNLYNRMTLNELAERFHISPTTLKLCFKNIYGAPLDTYVRAYRVQTAMKLLKDYNLTISEVAERVGYESPSRFSSVFKSYTRLSPSEFRAKYQ